MDFLGIVILVSNPFNHVRIKGFAQGLFLQGIMLGKFKFTKLGLTPICYFRGIGVS